MIVIKKKILLDFLGEEYAESYITVRSISVGEYDKLQGTVRDVVIDRFVTGEVMQDGKMVEITKETLLELPADVFIKAFESMTGTPDPKLQELSMKPSSTKPDGPKS